MVSLVYAIQAIIIFLETVQIIQLARGTINILTESLVFVILDIQITQVFVPTDVDLTRFLPRQDVSAQMDTTTFLEIVRHVLKTLISTVFHVFVQTVCI